jgi:hypothetical protein
MAREATLGSLLISKKETTVAHDNRLMILSSQQQQQLRRRPRQTGQRPQQASQQDDNGRLNQSSSAIGRPLLHPGGHQTKQSGHHHQGRGGALPRATVGTLPALVHCFALLLLVAVAGSLLACCASVSSMPLADDPQSSTTSKQQSVADTKAALEAELNSILQQQELGQEGANSKLLSEAIISRLMLGNLTDIGGPQEEGIGGDSILLETPEMAASDGENPILNGLDAQRLRRVLTFLQNYELAQSGGGGQTFNQFPVLPASQAATIKRASVKMNNFLRQQAQTQHGGQRQLNGYSRLNTFDFGLGKRPDSSVAGNVLRLGDSALAGGHMTAVSSAGLGKRPSGHRYDFGLGKRVASVSESCRAAASEPAGANITNLHVNQPAN